MNYQFQDVLQMFDQDYPVANLKTLNQPVVLENWTSDLAFQTTLGDVSLGAGEFYFDHTGKFEMQGGCCGCCGVTPVPTEFGGPSSGIVFGKDGAVGDGDGPQAKTTGQVFNEGAISSDVLQALVSDRAWDNSEAITFALQFSDFNGNSINDWNEDGAGTAMRLAMSLWDEVANITLTEVANTADANLVERIGDADGALGFHFFPNPNATQTTSGGETLPPHTSPGEYNQDGRGWDSLGLVQGGYGFITVIHEIGHGLGLEHPHDTDLLPGVLGEGDFGEADLNQGVYTTMSYNDGWSLMGGGSPDDGYGWQGTPMALDIAAIQAIYGADMTTRTGNNTYTLNDSNAAGTFFAAIWDAGGTDEIVYSGARNAFVFLGEATIDETATGGGLLSFVEGIHGGFTIAQNAVIENGTTGAGDDLLDGNDSDNVLNAGDGNDTIVGRDGADTLNGGLGNDVLIGDFVGLSSLQAVDSSIGGGISAGSGVIVAGQSTSNATISTAIDISDAFSFSSNGDIENSTTIPHVTVQGTGNGELDIFSIDINNPFARIIVDIDNTSAGMDAFVGIANSSGEFLAFNDDANPASGASGSVADLSSGLSLDSYLEFVPGIAGTYYVVVGTFPGISDIPAGETYDLHVSVENELGGAAPFAFFLDYFDFSATGGAADTLNGGAGDDDLYGGDGNDLLVGGSGDDFLSGDAGNDLLRGNSGADIINGGTGFDIAYYTDSNSGVTVRTDGGISSRGDAEGDLVTFVEGVIGSAFDDIFVINPFIGGYYDGSNGDDIFYGGAAAETLIGGDGVDRFLGRGGADKINGGSGFDLAYYTESSAGVIVRNDGGLSSGGDAEGDLVTFVEGIIGSAFDDIFVINPFFGGYYEGRDGDDIFYGGDAAETMLGGAGSDRLLGRGGADKLNGGDGFDFAYYTDSSSAVTVRTDGGISSGGDAEGDLVTFVEGVFGSAFGDVFVTNPIIGGYTEGRGGDDILYGGQGAEKFLGQGGNDLFVGRGGDDIFIGGAGNDTLVFGPGGGTDTFEDFEGGNGAGDLIKLNGFGSEYDTFEEILEVAMDQPGVIVRIDFGGGDAILLSGITTSDLSADDFLFA